MLPTDDRLLTVAVTPGKTALIDSLNGSNALDNPLTLQSGTLGSSAVLVINGGTITGGQSIDVTGTPKPGHLSTLKLGCNIGATKVTADMGSVVALEKGFVGTRPTAKDGGLVVPLA